MRPPFLHGTVSVEPFLGTGAGGPQYGTAVTVRASIQPEFKLVADVLGRQFVASAIAIVRPESTYPIESRVTTTDGRRFRIVDDSPMPSSTTPDHREWTLGSIQ